MAILTVSEQADMLNRLANEVIAGGHVVTLYPAYAQALLNVLAALEAVTAERDELSSLLAANVVVRAAQKLELDGVTAERDALAARVAAMEPDWTKAPEWGCGGRLTRMALRTGMSPSPSQQALVGGRITNANTSNPPLLRGVTACASVP